MLKNQAPPAGDPEPRMGGSVEGGRRSHVHGFPGHTKHDQHIRPESQGDKTHLSHAMDFVGAVRPAGRKGS